MRDRQSNPAGVVAELCPRPEDAHLRQRHACPASASVDSGSGGTSANPTAFPESESYQDDDEAQARPTTGRIGRTYAALPQRLLPRTTVAFIHIADFPVPSTSAIGRARTAACGTPRRALTMSSLPPAVVTLPREVAQARARLAGAAGDEVDARRLDDLEAGGADDLVQAGAVGQPPPRSLLPLEAGGRRAGPQRARGSARRCRRSPPRPCRRRGRGRARRPGRGGAGAASRGRRGRRCRRSRGRGRGRSGRRAWPSSPAPRRPRRSSPRAACGRRAPGGRRRGA